MILSDLFKQPFLAALYNNIPALLWPLQVKLHRLAFRIASTSKCNYQKISAPSIRVLANASFGCYLALQVGRGIVLQHHTCQTRLQKLPTLNVQ
jgi:hypothetical protein